MDVKIDFDGFDVHSVEPPTIPDLLAERPLMVFGKYRGSPSGTIIIRGVGGSGPFRKEITSLGPTARFAEHLSGLRFAYEADAGYCNADHGVVVAPGHVRELIS